MLLVAYKGRFVVVSAYYIRVYNRPRRTPCKRTSMVLVQLHHTGPGLQQGPSYGSGLGFGLDQTARVV